MSAKHEEDARRASAMTIDQPADIVKEERHGVDDAVPKPESIRNLSDEEIQALETKMVRKMDMVIMLVRSLSHYGTRPCGSGGLI